MGDVSSSLPKLPPPGGALDGHKLDSETQNFTVTGKGQLNVNVSGPAGTRASASGEGLLKDTRVQQETQMTPASKQGKILETEGSI
jgi:hypothetical protein